MAQSRPTAKESLRLESISNGRLATSLIWRFERLTSFLDCRDAKGVEVKQPGEEEKIKEVSDQFNRFQMMNFNEHHHCLRGTHLKTQGVCQPCPPATACRSPSLTRISVSSASSSCRKISHHIWHKACSPNQAHTTSSCDTRRLPRSLSPTMCLLLVALE